MWTAGARGSQIEEHFYRNVDFCRAHDPGCSSSCVLATRVIRTFEERGVYEEEVIVTSNTSVGRVWRRLTMGGVSSIWADHCTPGPASHIFLPWQAEHVSHLWLSWLQTVHTAGYSLKPADRAPGQCCSVNVTGIVCPVSRLRDHVSGVIMTRLPLLSLLVLASFLVMSLSAPSAICPHLNPRKTDRMHNLKLQFLFMMTQKKITLSFSSLVFCPPRVTCSKCRHAPWLPRDQLSLVFAGTRWVTQWRMSSCFPRTFQMNIYFRKCISI